MKSKLSDICHYVNGKVNVSELDNSTYVSTENMLPNKGGVTVAATLPTTSQTQLYEQDDVLVSNIRPYFKKIWFANQDGGCSNDVLVFRTNEGVEPGFLYYVLADNKFFNYSMATSKGTKMPRGDKKALMEYEVPDFDVDTQRKVASLLGDIDKKIELNQNINKNLAEQAAALFQAWFVKFEPYGGSMPDNWSEGNLGQIAELKTRSFSPAKNPDVTLEHYSIPSYDEKHFPVFEIASGVKSNKYVLTPSSVMISKLNPDTKRIWRPLCLTSHAVCSTEFMVYEAINPEHKDYVYSIIDDPMFSAFLCAHTTGSTNSRQRATPSVTLTYPVLIPPDDVINEFCSIVSPMYDLIGANTLENQKLANTRDSLLPKLMSGELNISGIIS